jgi:hypothetical protein
VARGASLVNQFAISGLTNHGCNLTIPPLPVDSTYVSIPLHTVHPYIQSCLSPVRLSVPIAKVAMYLPLYLG